MTTSLMSETWKPDFLIIGTFKAGTTTMMQNLLRHPNIGGPAKEVHFFSRPCKKREKEWYSEKDLVNYQEKFPSRNQQKFILGEKSNTYLRHPEAPSRIFSLYPQVKLIVMLRNPIDACYSYYWMRKRMRGHLETLSFEELLNNYLYFQLKYSINNWSIFSNLLYARQLKVWFDIFPREQILIIFFDDLERDMADAISSVVSFLGLPLQEDFNPTAFNRYQNTYPPMDAAIRQRLFEYYEPFNHELEALLGITLDWK